MYINRRSDGENVSKREFINKIQFIMNVMIIFIIIQSLSKSDLCENSNFLNISPC